MLNKDLIEDPPRKMWSVLNRIKTGMFIVIAF